MGNPPKEHQFKPGQSGNPSGRAKGEISLVHRLRKRLRENPKDVEAIIDALIAGAKKRDRSCILFIREAFDRVDGKAVQPIAGVDGGDIEIKVSFPNEKGDS